MTGVKVQGEARQRGQRGEQDDTVFKNLSQSIIRSLNRQWLTYSYGDTVASGYMSMELRGQVVAKDTHLEILPVDASLRARS